MGASAVENRKAGVAFRGHSLADGYRASLRLRSAVRVLCELAHGDLDTDEHSGRRAGTALYELTREAVDWPAAIPRGCTFSIEPRLWSCTGLTSTALVYTRVKDAICDALLDARGERPNPPDGPADVPLFVTLYQDRVTFYRDMCGTSLHRRGYRDAMHKASLNESVAAGLLHLAGWHRAALRPDGAVLADPMCGSGTILIEAALMAANVAPGLLRPPRSWPFQTWHDFEPRVWEACVEAAQEDVRPWDGELFGNDIHAGSLELAQRDAKRAGVSDFITWSLGDCRTWTPPALPDIVITNPPWGGRLLGEEDRSGGGMQERDSGQGGRRGRLRSVAAVAEEDENPELVAAWKSIDHWLAHQGKGTQAHVFSGNPSLFKHIWLKPGRRQPIVVSGVDTRLNSYVIKKDKATLGGAQDAVGS